MGAAPAVAYAAGGLRRQATCREARARGRRSGRRARPHARPAARDPGCADRAGRRPRAASCAGPRERRRRAPVRPGRSVRRPGRVPRDRLVAALHTARSACAGRRPRVLMRGPGSAPTPAASAVRRPLILSEPTHGHKVRFNLRIRVRVHHGIWGFLMRSENCFSPSSTCLLMHLIRDT